MAESINCQIRVKGHLSEKWVDWFGGLDIENQPNGEAVLSGTLADEAALYGVLKRIYDLGMIPISLYCVESGLDETSTPLSNEE